MVKVLELFAGIGAFSEALTELGIEHEIVDAVENDKFAIASFNAIHDTNFEPQDITDYGPDYYCPECHRMFAKNQLVPRWIEHHYGWEMKCPYCYGGMDNRIQPQMAKNNVDIIMHGSPCQDFSVAGKQAGGDEGSGTRSSLMYETLRIVKKLRPPIVIWENVKNILSKKHRHNFEAYCEAMKEMGYKNYVQVLNAKDFGVPQNRERVFTVSLLNGEFEFPEPQPLTVKLKDILEDEVNERYYLSEKAIAGFMRHNENHERKGTGFKWKPRDKDGVASCLRANGSLAPTDNTVCEQVGQIYGNGKELNPQAGRVYSENGISPTLDTCSGGNRMPKIIQRARGNNRGGEKELAPTISSSKWQDNNVLKEPVIAASRGRELKSSSENHTAQQLEVNMSGSSNTVTSVQKDNLVIEPDTRIRRLTPRECWRLMGFPDEAFERAAEVNSNTQLYKQAGNSIVVSVLKEIIKKLEIA